MALIQKLAHGGRLVLGCMMVNILQVICIADIL